MARIPMRANPQPPLLRVEPFKGMNTSVTPTQIDQSQSPDMLNINIDERGALNKRTGYKRIINSVGTGSINGMFLYKKPTGEQEFLFAHGATLYATSSLPNSGIVRDTVWSDDNLELTWEGVL